METANKQQNATSPLHISTASEMKLLKSKSQLITVEVTPQHLTLFVQIAIKKMVL